MEMIVEVILENWLERRQKHISDKKELEDINGVRRFLNKPTLSRSNIE